MITVDELIERAERTFGNRVLVIEDDMGKRLQIWTSEHHYSIRVTPTYLGCIASTRKPRPGEDWTRGNDLPDGGLSWTTWDAILAGIVRYEALPILPPAPSKDTPVGVEALHGNG